jgi:hypothetical protein
LTTGLAFDKIPGSSPVMLKCRQLVSHFNASSQATDLLIEKQSHLSRSVNLIQDVKTRWWSTYMMLSRLLRLRPYLTILFTEKSVNADLSLNVEEWLIVEDTKRILEPFMIAQRILEGEKYVTISLVLIIITTIRENLRAELEKPDNSAHVKQLCLLLLSDFNKHWGTGSDGTVWLENQTLGERNRPKGIPQATLMATFLDPRTKDLRELGNTDKAFVLKAIKEKLLSFGPINLVRFQIFLFLCIHIFIGRYSTSS